MQDGDQSREIRLGRDDALSLAQSDQSRWTNCYCTELPSFTGTFIQKSRQRKLSLTTASWPFSQRTDIGVLIGEAMRACELFRIPDLDVRLVLCWRHMPAVCHPNFLLQSHKLKRNDNVDTEVIKTMRIRIGGEKKRRTFMSVLWACRGTACC